MSEVTNPSIEDIFETHCTGRLERYTMQSRGYTARLFRDDWEKKSNHAVIVDDRSITLLDDVVVTGDGKRGYEILLQGDHSMKQSTMDFERLLIDIVSTTNVISVVKTQEGFTAKLASHRAGPGRIWYTRPGGGGVAFSNDFRTLLDLSRFEVDLRGYYAIIRHGSCPDPITIIVGIQSVPVSHYAVCSTPGFQLRVFPYFQFDFPESRGHDISPAKETLERCTQALSQMNPGLLLSGGVDSTLLAHYLAQGGKISAFHLSFGEADPELRFAKYAAEETGIHLDVVHMQHADVIPAIVECATSYIHPFSDISSIPTLHLIRHVQRDHGEVRLLVDGTGADGCFSLPANRRRLLLWQLFYLQPRMLRRFESALSERFATHSSNELIDGIVQACAHGAERDIEEGLMTLSCHPYESVFRREALDMSASITAYFRSVYNSCIADRSYNRSICARSAVLDVLYTAVKRAALKTYRVANEHSVDVAFPFLWRDVLIEQGMLSWKCKMNNGTSKWPLKKLLAEHMPSWFVYRRKNPFGFDPPLLDWLGDEEIFGFVSNVLLDEHGYVQPLIPIAHLNRILDRIRKKQRVSSETLELVWAVLLTELWLRENRISYMRNGAGSRTIRSWQR